MEPLGKCLGPKLFNLYKTSINVLTINGKIISHGADTVDSFDGITKN